MLKWVCVWLGEPVKKDSCHFNSEWKKLDYVLHCFPYLCSGVYSRVGGKVCLPVSIVLLLQKQGETTIDLPFRDISNSLLNGKLRGTFLLNFEHSKCFLTTSLTHPITLWWFAQVFALCQLRLSSGVFFVSPFPWKTFIQIFDLYASTSI